MAPVCTGALRIEQRKPFFFFLVQLIEFPTTVLATWELYQYCIVGVNTGSGIEEIFANATVEYHDDNDGDSSVYQTGCKTLFPASSCAVNMTRVLE